LLDFTVDRPAAELPNRYPTRPPFMKFANVNGTRTEPSPKLRGDCCYCGAPTSSRCGTKRVWHWAHKPNTHCDPWWENETEWHRQWKSFFPVENQEIVHFDDNGEKHIADVKSDCGTVIEFQNSTMDSTELKSRETFYGEMFWIVNASKFEKNFHVLDRLPNPLAKFAQDIVFCARRAEWLGRGFWRLSENPDHTIGSDGLVEIHNMKKIDDKIDAEYVGHHLYDWKRPRTVWYESTKRVLLDFGFEDSLMELQTYRVYGAFALPCVQYVSKRELIESYGGAARSEIVG
jgi:hypothetical protein